MAFFKRRRGPRPSRDELTIIRALEIILMFDALLALLKKLDTDDGAHAAEIAELEQAKNDLTAKMAADEQAFADLSAKVAALGAPVDTSTFATKTDLTAAIAALPPPVDTSTFAKQADLDALEAAVAALDPTAPPPPPPAFAVTPAAVNFGAGAPSTELLTIIGGTAPFSATNLPAGVTFTGSELDGDATTVAGSTDVTITDSATPPNTATVTVVVA